MSLWDDEAGFSRDDPKHPDWAEGMRDLGDGARKALRERGDVLERLADADEEAVDGPH